MYQQNRGTHNREIHSWTSLYFALHAQTTETVLPVAHSANAAPKRPGFAMSRLAVKTNMFHVPLTSGSHSFKACVFVAFTSVSSSLLDSAFITPPSEGCGGLSGTGSSSGRVGRGLRHPDPILTSTPSIPVSVTARVSPRIRIIGVLVKRGLRWS